MPKDDRDSDDPLPPSDATPPPASPAPSRLAQLAGHLPATTSTSASSPPARRRRRRPSRAREEPGLPADYSDVLAQLATIRRLAATPDVGSRGYAAQKRAGKLWVRERVVALFDAGSVREVGSAAGRIGWEAGAEGGPEGVGTFVPSNNVQGFGKLGGRRVLFTADDFSLRAGHADGALAEKTIYIEKLALALRLPMVKLVDGSSGGGSVTTIRETGHSYIPPLPTFPHAVEQLNAGIPNLGAVLGPAIGLGAARVVACHFSVMAADVGSLFAAGPRVVAGATFEEGLSPQELGGPDVHCANGTIDNLAPDEAGCFDQLRAVVAFLPSHGVSQLPPYVPCEDPPKRPTPELRTVVPRARNRAYDVRTIIHSMVDQLPASSPSPTAATAAISRSNFFEIGRLWGLAAVVGLARISGRPVGIIASNPVSPTAGALDAATSLKMARHLRLCDVFNLPVVQLVDCPGYAVGTRSERSGAMRDGVALAAAYYATTVPVFSVVVRRAYGVAGAAMLDSRAPNARVAWPSGEWGSLPLEGGVEVGHAHELREVEQREGRQRREERRAELEGEYRRLMNPVRTAGAFGVEEIIDPAETRAVVAAWVEMMYDGVLPVRVAERVAGKLSVKFC